ncbi:MAG: hypothetical protein HYZ75_05865 [Elusimicrobia bacterium]|nr:hypothetical protein [Elusimicrobiota bacterium]
MPVRALFSGFLAAVLAAAPAAAQIRAAAVAAEGAVVPIRPVVSVPTLAPTLSSPGLTAPTLAPVTPTASPSAPPSILQRAEAASPAPAAAAALAAPVGAVNAVAAPTPSPAESGKAAAPDAKPPLKLVETAGRAASEKPAADAGAEAASAWAAKAFDNSWVTRGEAAGRLPFDPVAAEGRLLSDPSKTDWSSTRRVSRHPVVLKRFSPIGQELTPRKAAQNELLSRLFVSHPVFADIFKDAFSMPAAVAYPVHTWNPLATPRAMVAMEEAPGKPYGSFHLHDERSYLPRRLFGPLFVLATALGLGDLNPGALLLDDQGRYSLIDTELARHESKPNKALITTADMPWLEDRYLNDAADFRPAMAAFEKAFAKLDAGGGLDALLAKAGLTASEVKRDAALIRGNVARFDAVLEADLYVANSLFMKKGGYDKLSEKQLRALSAFNRALLSKDGSAAEARARTMRALAEDALSVNKEMPLYHFPILASNLRRLTSSESARAHLRAVTEDGEALPAAREAAAAVLEMMTP